MTTFTVNTDGEEGHTIQESGDDGNRALWITQGVLVSCVLAVVIIVIVVLRRRQCNKAFYIQSVASFLLD